MLLIKNGLVHNAVDREPFAADILVENGKIQKIAEHIDCPEAQVFDAAGLMVYPGFVEAHGHIGLDGYGIGFEGQDYNEYGDPMTPQLRAIDGIQAKYGSASLRRGLQLAALYPGHEIRPVRGNLQTRLRKLDEGQYGALVLAAAGLKRLGLEHRIGRYFTPEEMIPAPGGRLQAARLFLPAAELTIFLFSPLHCDVSCCIIEYEPFFPCGEPVSPARLR